jgi:RND family efflux transporter MFP subunit
MTKTLSRIALGAVLTSLVGCFPDREGPTPPSAAKKDAAAPAAFEAEGRTQAVPSRRAIIAPVPQHPVEEVLVKVGQRVKKGQVLIKMDADEPEADVRNKKALLEGAVVTTKEARRHLEALEGIYRNGSLPEATYHTARAAALKAEQDERAAKAALESSEAELEHYTMVAPIDGVVSWLDVNVGMVAWPGRTVWGEILDLSEIDVRCDLTPEQVERVEVGQAADVRRNGGKESLGEGRVVLVGIDADKANGLTPVVVRLDNAKSRLRSGAPVKILFKEASAPGGSK